MKKPSEVTVEDLKTWAAKQPGDRYNPGVLGDADELVSTTCSYIATPEANNGTFYCIAGQFFIDHGISKEDLAKWDGNVHERPKGVDNLAHDVAEYYGFKTSVGAKLAGMQVVADGDQPWADAIEAVFPDLREDIQ